MVVPRTLEPAGYPTPPSCSSEELCTGGPPGRGQRLQAQPCSGSNQLRDQLGRPGLQNEYMYIYVYTLEVVDMSRNGGCNSTISGGMYESCGVHYMFPGCQATALALHARKEAFVPLGSRQEAMKFA